MSRSGVKDEESRDEMKREEMISSPPLMQMTTYTQCRRGVFAFACQNFTTSDGSSPSERLPKPEATTMDKYPLRSVVTRRPEAMGSINGGSMQVFTDPSRNQVIIRGEGNEIRLSWAAALNLGSLLIKKAEEAEPPARPGKTYRPAIER